MRILVFSFLLMSGVTLLWADTSTNYVVSQVVDGDTIEVNQKTRVDLAGIDTPEAYENRKLYRDAAKYKMDIYKMMGIGQEARLFTRGILKGKKIRLETEGEQESSGGRLFGSVFIKICNAPCQVEGISGHVYRDFEDGVYDFVNATLVNSGYAVVSPYSGVKYRDQLEDYEKDAQLNRRGLWI